MNALFFSKNECRGIVALASILIILSFVYFFLSSAKPIPEAKNQKKITERKNIIPISLVEFDPNFADSTTLLHLGLKPYVIKNLLNYRKAGGKIRTKEQLSQIYGLDSSTFQQISPYIVIPPPPKKALIELNKADSIQLVSIRGIGPVISKRIITFRTKLGGFHSTKQIKEVYGINKEYLPSIYSAITVDEKLLKKISVNSSSMSELNKHPYITYAQANALVRTRSIKRIINWEEIIILDEFTTKDERLKPYISF